MKRNGWKPYPTTLDPSQQSFSTGEEGRICWSPPSGLVCVQNLDSVVMGLCSKTTLCLMLSSTRLWQLSRRRSYGRKAKRNSKQCAQHTNRRQTGSGSSSLRCEDRILAGKMLVSRSWEKKWRPQKSMSTEYWSKSSLKYPHPTRWDHLQVL